MNKKFVIALAFALLIFVSPAGVSAGNMAKPNACTTIQSGMLYSSSGEQLSPGYDAWGYNYQAHLFNGSYCDYHPTYRPGGANHDWCMENYGGTTLKMKWNQQWLSNVDCDGDGLLDRHSGFDSYIGSGAWETNHMNGSYQMDGKTCHWEYFVKIIAAPADAAVVDGMWYNSDGVLIGEAIWGAFAIIQQVENDPCDGLHGLQFLSPDHPGFGGW